ncbi:NAD(P)/FAD-dependent oxidoreductase [Stieleria varia]|uniref:D-amino acid dehydrogenase small subunit n=1 Tax=Stieleria varia TaxID=2528005 RepID=A0A5C6B1T8_9BACT|nr:FAD-dependent oxidoreductase [Stieleria varia]TWU05868.1 D-amino acid dehydrogenase small subunit [Stieleria varia]
MTAKPPRVVIVGAGVIGLSAAWYCRRAGYDVTVIERSPQQRDSCSFGNAGLLVPSHFVPLASPGMVALGLRMMMKPRSPFYIKPRLSADLLSWMWRFQKACTKSHVEQSAPLLRDLNMRSRACYQVLQDELPGGFGLQNRGLAMLCRSEAMLHEETEMAEMAHRLEIPAEVLDSSGIERLNPGLDVDVVGGVFYPNDCHLSPATLMSSLVQQLTGDGCRFVWNTPCLGFVADGHAIRAVKTDQHEIEADNVVLASGVWSAELGRQLKLSLPMQAGKGYSVTVPDPPQMPTVSAILTEARVAVTPMGDSLRFGGTMELSGIDGRINQDRVQGILDSIPQYFPAMDTSQWKTLTAWSGLRPCSPDGLPYLGPTRRWQNLVLSTGHAMMGISLALVSGEMVAQWIRGDAPKVSGLQLLSPDRFG